MVVRQEVRECCPGARRQPNSVGENIGFLEPGKVELGTRL